MRMSHIITGLVLTVICLPRPAPAQADQHDVASRFAAIVQAHRRFYAGHKVPPGDLPPLLDDGRLMTSTKEDLFSITVNSWGGRLIKARTADGPPAQLDTIAAWAGDTEQGARQFSAMIAQFRHRGVEVPPNDIILPGEFAPSVNSGPATVDGILARMDDLDRWMVLNAQWTLLHVQLIRQYTPEFRRSWGPSGIYGAVFGLSLVQRIYDTAEIQVLCEDMLELSAQEEIFRERAPGAPVTLGPGVGFVSAELAGRLPEPARAALADLAGRPYEMSCLTAQLRRCLNSKAGGRFMAEKIAAAVTAHVTREGSITPAALAELINYRQGEVQCGFRPEARFAPELVPAFLWLGEGGLLDAAALAVDSVTVLTRDRFTKGGSADIIDALAFHRIDSFRQANIAGALLANAGFTGIHPMRRGDHAFLGLATPDGIITCDPNTATAPGRKFPLDFADQGEANVTLFARTVGGFVAWRTLVRPQDPVVVIEMPYAVPPVTPSGAAEPPVAPTPAGPAAP
ncbi:MAG: hypothetical protein ABIF71_13095 [Planctomycetota bacterium]